MQSPRSGGHGWIGVDFDGTLAEYHGFKGKDHFGDPIDSMVKRVRVWLREGKDVRLFTARHPTPGLRRWMKEHLGQVLPITNVKDYHMQLLIDDRAIGVERNTGKLDNHERLKELS